MLVLHLQQMLLCHKVQLVQVQLLVHGLLLEVLLHAEVQLLQGVEDADAIGVDMGDCIFSSS